MVTKKLIPGYTNYYATAEGDIYRLIGGRYRRLLACKGKKGYLTVNIPDTTGIKHRRKVHRLIAITFIPNPHNYPNICHKDNNPQNNHIDNLYWGTQSMNMQQMVNDGRQRKSKVNMKYASKVMGLLHEGLTPMEILRHLPGLSSTSLYRIIKRNK